MSATRSEDSTNAVAHQEGEFSSRVPRDEPQTTHGHQVGREPGPPEKHAEVLPAGTAPADRTFAPQNEPDNVVVGAGSAAANDFPGATSADVHTGLGHPGQGMSSKELRHDGQSHRERQGGGLTGLTQTGGFDQESNDGKRAGMSNVDGKTFAP